MIDFNWELVFQDYNDDSLNNTKRYVNLKKIYADLGEEIKSIRKSRGMTEAELAKIINISQQQISRYELGVNHLNLVRIIEIINALELSPVFLYEIIKPYIYVK